MHVESLRACTFALQNQYYDYVILIKTCWNAIFTGFQRQWYINKKTDNASERGCRMSNFAHIDFRYVTGIKKKIKKALKLQIFKVGKKLAEFELMTIKMIETRKSSSGERQIKRVITSIKKFQHKSYFKLRRRELKELLKKHKQFHRQVALQTPEPVRFSNWQSAIHQFGYWSDAFDSTVIFVSLWRDWWPSFLILR